MNRFCYRKLSVVIMIIAFVFIQINPIFIIAAGYKSFTASFTTKAAPSIDDITVKTETIYATVTGSAISDASVLALDFSTTNLKFLINGTYSITLNASDYTNIDDIAKEIQRQLTFLGNSDIYVSSTRNALNTGGYINMTRIGGGIIIGNAVTGSLSDIGLLASTTPPTTTSAISLSPGVTYDIHLIVSDPDGLGNIDGGLQQLEVKLWYDSTGTNFGESYFDSQTSPSAMSYANILWQRSLTEPAISDGAGITWSLEGRDIPTSAQLADDTYTSHEFVFKVKIGEVSKETAGAARWHIGAKVTDAENLKAYHNFEEFGGSAGLIMNWFGKINMTTTDSSITWPRVPVGLTFASTSSSLTVSGMELLANGDYDKRVCAQTTWVALDASTVTRTLSASGTNEFALKADNVSTYNLATAKEIPANEFSTVRLNDIPLAANTEDSILTPTNNYLFLQLNSSFPVSKKFTGTITFIISNN